MGLAIWVFCLFNAPVGWTYRAGMTVVISTAGLHKSFGRTRALAGLDLEVLAGEVHGFLGPNGAGRTTALRVILGLLR